MRLFCSSGLVVVMVTVTGRVMKGTVAVKVIVKDIVRVQEVVKEIVIV